MEHARSTQTEHTHIPIYGFGKSSMRKKVKFYHAEYIKEHTGEDETTSVFRYFYHSKLNIVQPIIPSKSTF